MMTFAHDDMAMCTHDVTRWGHMAPDNMQFILVSILLLIQIKVLNIPIICILSYFK